MRAGSRVPEGPKFFVRPFVSTPDAAVDSSQSSREEALAILKGLLRPISQIPLRLATEAGFLEFYGELAALQPFLRPKKAGPVWGPSAMKRGDVT